MTSAGSPGKSCCRVKMITDTKNRVGTSCSSRLDRKASIRALLELQSHHPHEAVGHLPIAVEARRVGDQDPAVIEVELRNIVENDFRKLLVDRLAGGEIGDDARFIEQPIGLAVAIAGIVLRRLALVEDIGV